jgi:hypothetical protein
VDRPQPCAQQRRGDALGGQQGDSVGHRGRGDLIIAIGKRGAGGRVRVHHRDRDPVPAGPDDPPHGLRHGAATLALAAGADLKVVQDQLGHSTITLTADTYTSVLPETARTAAEHTAALLFPARQPSSRRPAPRRAPRSLPAWAREGHRTRSHAA